MALQIIILNTNTQLDGSFSVSGVFWLVPSTNIKSNSNFISQYESIDSSSLLSLQAGTLVEKPFNSGLFPSGTSLSDVQIALQSQYDAAQIELNTLSVSGLTGTVFDGYTWQNADSLQLIKPINIGPQYTKRNHYWTDWKNVTSNLIYQSYDDGTTYTIWAYDGPEVHISTIWKNTVPATIVNLGYTQTQNDLDKTDFETNYQSNSNKTIVKLSATGIAGQSPSKGLGGFVPDPSNNPYQPGADEVVGLYVDAEGSLVTRGAAITDEGSFREDFTTSSLSFNLTGNVTFTNGSNIITGTSSLFASELNRDYYIKSSVDGDGYWTRIIRVPSDNNGYLESPYLGSSHTGAANASRWIPYKSNSDGYINLFDSKAYLYSGTEIGGINLYRGGDYLPLIAIVKCSLSQRIISQIAYIGFRDNINNPMMYCDVVFNGTDNTKVLFRSAWNGDEQSTLVSLPPGLTTDQFLRYKIDMSMDYCGLLVNGVLVARHEDHIPDPYASMILCCGIDNNSLSSLGELVIDTYVLSNQDQLQISSQFLAPLAVITREDQHTINSSLITDSTAFDQTVISYTVPAGKVCYLVGYKVDCSGTAGTIKIGNNDISSEPSFPGVVDGNIFRVFDVQENSTTGEIDFGSIPRKLGVGGDNILLTITPGSAIPTIWRASLDIVLR